MWSNFISQVAQWHISFFEPKVIHLKIKLHSWQNTFDAVLQKAKMIIALSSGKNSLMKIDVKKNFIILLSVQFLSCKQESKKLNKEELLKIVTDLGNQFDKGIKGTDFDVIASIYADDAMYVQDEGPIRKGKADVMRQWHNDLDFGLQGLTLHPEWVEQYGSAIAEVGTGFSNIKQKTKNGTDTSFMCKFKYTNVWEKTGDGNYKLKVDNYNSLTYEGWPPGQ